MYQISQHPQALYILALVELLERFSFYGIRSLLILYMSSKLLFSDIDAYSVYATFAALLFAIPVISGTLADKMLGIRKAVNFGALLILIGNIMISYQSPLTFYVSLAFIALGTGLLKSNIMALLGKFYDKEDYKNKRDSGFTIFYVAINIGGFLAPIICGYVGHKIGWHFGFLLAGIGMLIGSMILMVYSPLLEEQGAPPNLDSLKQRYFFLTRESIIKGIILLLTPCFATLLYFYSAMDYLMPIIALTFLIYSMYIMAKISGEERKGFSVILILMIFHTIFWAFYEQAGSSIHLFTERNVQRMIFNYEIPTAWFLALNPLLVILIGPLFSSLWTKLAINKQEPSVTNKFILSLLLLSMGFISMYVSNYFANTAGTVSIYWVLLGHFFHTMGELCSSPIGLSMVTRLAPKGYKSTLMGMWFLSVSFSNYIAGLVARIMTVYPGTNGGINKVLSLKLYTYSFGQIAIITLLAACCLLLIKPFIEKRLT